MVSKSPRPAPSCHWTRLLILDTATREPRMQRLVARSRLMRAYKRIRLLSFCCKSKCNLFEQILSFTSNLLDGLWKPRMARMIDTVPNRGEGISSSSPFLVVEVRHKSLFHTT
jgi:hypothetical protein